MGAGGGQASAMEAETRGSDPSQEEASGEPHAGDSMLEGESPAPPHPRRDRGRTIALGAMGVLLALGIGMFALSPKSDGPTPLSLSLTSGERSGPQAGDPDAGGASSPPARPPPVWRVSSLKDDPALVVAEGTFGRRGLVAALTDAGLPRPEVKRVIEAFEGVRRVNLPSSTDGFVFAMDKASGALVAFEYVTSPRDVWQARLEEGSEGKLSSSKLDLFVERRHVGTSLVVSADLAKAVEEAGLQPSMIDAVDDALENHVEPGSIRSGTRMRIVTTEDWVEGALVQRRLSAVEFVPTSGSPTRVYHYERDPAQVDDSPRRAPRPGFYCSRARQPFRGDFRLPVALARVTSRYNPKRKHPVLKKIMPHNGVDFGGAPGTPVYAAGAGTVVRVGKAGACGNMIELSHPGGVRTIYCHLRNFVQGLRVGQRVEPRQHIGYIGQTGRVTGPHLHFGVKRNGAFVDPFSLKMDGFLVLPPADRDVFARMRAELDEVIDGVPLPSAADTPDEPEEHFHEEDE